MKNLSIVIPAYNELSNFKSGALNQVDTYLKKNKLNWEVIIVDDGSTDGSSKLIEDYVKNKNNWHFIQNTHQGKTNTIKTGVFVAKNPYTLFTDFDQSTPVSEAEKLTPFTTQGFKIVIGSREIKGSHREKEPWYRHLMGKGFNLAVKIIAVKGIHDTQCGFKLFETKTAQQLFKSLKVYKSKGKLEKHAFTGAFDVELLFIANKHKIKIAEVPISWQHAPTNRVNPIRDSLRMLIDILKIRLYHILGSYKQI